jgi:predicted acyltransferase
VFCVALLLLGEILYRFTNIPGFDQPFTNQHNFGNYVDLVLTGSYNQEGWVSFNWLNTAVHTIAGSLTGKLMLSPKNKIGPLLLWGVACVLLGVLMNLTGATPIIKKIATSSFTLTSLGFCLWGFAFCYWWIDVLQHRKYLEFFTIVGMNSIFIYLFFEIIGSRWFNEYVFSVTGGIMKLLHTPAVASTIISSMCIFSLEWGACYFLYKKKIFLRI